MGSTESTPADAPSGGGGYYGSRKTDGGGRSKDGPAQPIRPKNTVLFDGMDVIQATDTLTQKSKSLAHRKQLETYLRRCYLFESLSGEEMSAVVDAFHKKGVPAGSKHPLMSQGDMGEAFYVVHEGTFRYSKDGVEVGEFVVGESFGELALLHNTVRDMTVAAVDNPATVWTIDRATFRRTLAVVHRDKRSKLVFWFNKVPMLSKLKPEETMDLVDSVRTANFSAGQRIVRQGDPSTTLYMVQVRVFFV